MKTKKEEIRIATKEETVKIAKKILEEHKKAFEALAKEGNNDQVWWWKSFAASSISNWK